MFFLDDFKDSIYTFENWDPRFPWGPYTHGLHYNTPRQNFTFTEDGFLEIESRYENYTGELWAWDSAGNFYTYEEDFEYTSGMLYHKQPVEEGYFECRFKTSNAHGTNAAFWLYGPEATEIDVFEIKGSEPNKAQMTLHWKDRDPISRSSQNANNIYLQEGTFASQFHTMGVSWTQDEVRWYYDTIPLRANGFDEFIRSRHVPQVPMHVILTQEVGTIDKEVDSTTYPGTFSIDYVAFYQQTSLVAPRIISHTPMQYTVNQSFEVAREDLQVWDSLGFYPKAHRVNVLPGANYSVISNRVYPDQDFSDTLLVTVTVDNGIDESAVYEIPIPSDRTNGIYSLQEAASWVYPNPARDFLTVATPFLQISLVAQDGRVVKSLSGNNQEQLQTYIGNIEAGLYRLRIKKEKGIVTIPFVKL